MATSLLASGSWSYDREDPTSCPECMLPVDDDDPDATHCPWCGARNPEPLQTVVWAELEAMELAWPDALGA